MISPKNIINYNKFILADDVDGEKKLINEYTIPWQGELDASEIINHLRLLLTDKEDITRGLVEYPLDYFDQGLFKYSNRLQLVFKKSYVFVCEDYWLCKVLGCNLNERIYTTIDKFNNYILTFPRRMFTGLARILNVMCYFI